MGDKEAIPVSQGSVRCVAYKTSNKQKDFGQKVTRIIYFIFVNN